ncbi:MAG TPA: YggT family protein [Campylobacterales bacterium]|nr:YggT family protein [Campylobacterales bacterium]HHS92017.1 YggT family protein [Campylobacterales bacterium]
MDLILQPILLMINVYIWIVIISVILSLLQVDPRQPAVELLRRITEPAFKFIRQKLPFVVIGGLDLSPLVLIVSLQLIVSLLAGNIVMSIAGIISSLIYFYIILAIIAVILSYVQVNPYNPIVQTIQRLTEPVFSFIRQKLPFVVIGGIDLSPLIVIFGLQVIDSLIIGTLLGL